MAAPKLNVDTSIIDYLKSTKQDTSYGARAKMAVDLGIVKAPNQYTGTADQNISLLNKLKTGTPKTPTQVVTQDQATSFINANQTQDVAAAQTVDEPPVRNNGADLVDVFKKATGKTGLVPDYTLPTAPNFEESFSQMRQKYGVDDLEATVNDLDIQEQDLQAQKRISTDAELGKPVAMNVIGGRVSEQERNFNERIDFVGRQKTRAINELKTATDTIENMMNLRKMDYEVAKGRYDTEFAQNIQLFNTLKGVAEFNASEEEKAADNARSNLQIIYNSIKDGGLDAAAVDPTTKAKISKLELQAGLPQGFYDGLAAKKPDSKVLSTTTREAGGVKYADVIFQNPDGSISTQNIKLGAASSGGGGTKPTESELMRSARGEIAGQLNGRTGDDGYVAPTDYKKARSAWVSKGFSAKDFDEAFANEYANPVHYQDYGVTLF